MISKQRCGMRHLHHPFILLFSPVCPLRCARSPFLSIRTIFFWGKQGRWGQMSPKLGVGLALVPRLAFNLEVSTPHEVPILLSRSQFHHTTTQLRAKSARRHLDTPTPASPRNGWPELLAPVINHPGIHPRNSKLTAARRIKCRCSHAGHDTRHRAKHPSDCPKQSAQAI